MAVIGKLIVANLRVVQKRWVPAAMEVTTWGCAIISLFSMKAAEAFSEYTLSAIVKHGFQFEVDV